MTDQPRTKILIADDEPISRKLLEKLLSDKVNAEFHLARDGEEAWEFMQNEFAPMVIADWMMPRMDGIELCRRLREAAFSRYIYFILVTARDDQADVVRGLEAGADDYIRKPFDPNELQSRVKAGLRLIDLEDELARKNEELKVVNLRLEELARVDALMKIGNRNSFYEAIEQLQNEALRYNRRYGLIMCDVDYFKQYNDTLGHQAGDKVLEQVARTIRENIRPSDRPFRYGGEEIVVLLPEQDLAGTVVTAERIRRAIEDEKMQHPKGASGIVTLSLGAASYHGADHPFSHWREVLEQADQALYRAKHEGRNRVCRWDPALHSMTDDAATTAASASVSADPSNTPTP
jgi:two-component system chemotaxis response regulator CheY